MQLDYNMPMRTAFTAFLALTGIVLSCLPAHAATIGNVDQAICAQMAAHGVHTADSPVSCDRLRIVRFSYVGFDGKTRDDGKIMVLDAAAAHVRSLFEALLQRRFPIAGARLMHHYRGDDEASMRDNNSSGFNHRAITGGASLSLHAYGLAIDLNPVQNPFIVLEQDGQAQVRPQAGTAYVNRARLRPGKAPRGGLAEQVVSVFAYHGFPVWGGDWDNPIDYQHFQVSRSLAERLASLAPDKAAEAFRLHVKRYRDCMRAAQAIDAACRQSP